MRSVFNFINLSAFICLLFFAQVSIGQSIIYVESKKDKGDPGEKPCERFVGSGYYVDKYKLLIAPDINTTSFFINDFKIYPLLAQGINLTKYEYSAKIIEPISGKLLEIDKTIIDSNSTLLNSNGKIELEVLIKGIYRYEQSLYNGSNPLVFEFLLDGYKLNSIIGDFSTPFYSDIIYDPKSTVECIEDENTRTFQNNTIDFASVYPNPSNGNFILDISIEKEVLITLEIYNSVGQRTLIPHKNLIMKNGTKSLKINLSDYPNGIYYLKVFTNDIFQYLKLIKKS